MIDVDNMKEEIKRFKDLNQEVADQEKELQTQQKEYDQEMNEFRTKYADVLDNTNPNNPIVKFFKEPEEKALAEKLGKINSKKEEVENKKEEIKKEFDEFIEDAKKEVKSQKEVIERQTEDPEAARRSLEEEKEKLLRDRETYEDRIKGWEENNINPNDSIYKHIKDSVIPKTDMRLSNIDSKLEDLQPEKMAEDYKQLENIEDILNNLHTMKYKIDELSELLDLDIEETLESNSSLEQDSGLNPEVEPEEVINNGATADQKIESEEQAPVENEKEKSTKEPEPPQNQEPETESEEVIEDGYIGLGFPSLEEQFEKITGKKRKETDEYEVVYDGTTDDQGIEDGVYTPFKIVNKREEPTKEPEPKPEPQPTPTPRPNPQPGKELVVDDGLIVFNDIFQGKFDDKDSGVAMPEIKAKHTLSENPLWQAAAGAPAIAGLLGLGGIPAIVGGATAAIFIKPILKRITGQKKVTQQIEDVLERVEETAPERFELLENWMTEEQAIDMTPNHVFLDAMQKVLTRRAARIEQENNVRLEEIEEKLHDSGISISEKKALDKEREDIRKETADAKMRSKRVRRGKEHTSHEDRDNVNGGFFSLRNPTTKQYKDALNELTERRKEVLVAEKSDDIEKKITARDEYEKYLLDNSKAKHVRRMPFNAKEGVVGIASRDVSDRKDNRVRNATYIAVGLAAAVNSIMEMLKLENAQQQASDIANQNAKYLEDARNQINKIQQEAQANGDSLTQKQIQQVLNKEVMDKANAAEVSIMRGNGGSLIGSQYRAGDEALNIDVQNGVDTVHSTSQTISNLGGSDKLFGTVRKLLEMKQSGLSTEEALSRASNGQLLGGYSVDHAAQAELFAGNQNAQYGNAEMDLLRKLLDTAESASKVNIPQGSKVGKISANFIGAITSACLPIIRAIKDHTRKDKVETKVDNESKDKEENNEHYENERN